MLKYIHKVHTNDYSIHSGKNDRGLNGGGGGGGGEGGVLR